MLAPAIPWQLAPAAVASPAALRPAAVGPLAKLNELKLPGFFLCGEFDRLCPGARLKEVLAEVLPDCDCRVIVLEASGPAALAPLLCCAPWPAWHAAGGRGSWLFCDLLPRPTRHALRSAAAGALACQGCVHGCAHAGHAPVRRPTLSFRGRADAPCASLPAAAPALQDLSGRFCIPGTKDLEEGTLAAIVGHVQAFAAALNSGGEGGGGLAACPLPRAADLQPSSRPLPDVPESPKRAPSPELEEPEPDSPPPPPRGARGGATRRGPPGAAAGAAAAAVRPGVPGGMIPVMGPNGQPMLVPAAAIAGNPAAQQQLMMMQQTMLAAMQKQQAAGGGGGAAGPAAAAAQQQMQLQMALAMQQMAAAQRAAGVAAGAAGAAPSVNPAALAAPNPAIAAMFQQQQQQGGAGAVPMAVDAQQE